MNPEEAKETLQRFSSVFQKMISYSFYKVPLRYQMKSDDHGITSEIEVPNDEQIDAVLLNLRFFVVNNEGTSFPNIPKAYKALNLPANLQDKFDATYSAWNIWRKESSRLAGTNNADFFSIMIYGARVHRNNKEFCDIYDALMKHALLKNISIVGFCEAITEMTVQIQAVVDLNYEVLAYLDSQKADASKASRTL